MERVDQQSRRPKCCCYENAPAGAEENLFLKPLEFVGGYSSLAATTSYSLTKRGEGAIEYIWDATGQVDAPESVPVLAQEKETETAYN